MVRVLLMALANQDISVLSTKHAKVPVTPLAPHGVCLARILPFPPHVDMKAFYVMISRVRSGDSLRVLGDCRLESLAPTQARSETCSLECVLFR